MTSYRAPVRVFQCNCIDVCHGKPPLAREVPLVKRRKSAAAFEKLISLVGEWEGTNSAGAVKATYTLVSGRNGADGAPASPRMNRR